MANEEIEKRMADKVKYLLKNFSTFESEMKKIDELGRDLETRIRILESIGIDKIRDDIHKIDNRIEKLESRHDDSKEKVKRIADFIVQLAWVSLAAWLLTKLGLQAPL